MKKKIILLGGVLCILAAGKTFAQAETQVMSSNGNVTTSTAPATTYGTGKSTTAGRTSFGIKAGVNFNNINGKYANGDKMKNSLLPGWNAGINVEVPIAPDFYLQPGLLFTTAGAKLDNEELNQAYNTTIHLSYLELPVNFVYKPMLGAGHLIAGIGPYVDLGVSGKIAYSGTGAPSSDKDVKFKNTVSSTDQGDVAYFRSFGAGGNLLFGYEFANRLSFQLDAQLGLTDINPKYSDSDGRPKATKTGFGISAGYRF